jgi:hypothetical protein
VDTAAALHRTIDIRFLPRIALLDVDLVPEYRPGSSGVTSQYSDLMASCAQLVGNRTAQEPCGSE